jgi:hypothetical protein
MLQLGCLILRNGPAKHGIPDTPRDRTASWDDDQGRHRAPSGAVDAGEPVLFDDQLRIKALSSFRKQSYCAIAVLDVGGTHL